MVGGVTRLAVCAALAGSVSCASLPSSTKEETFSRKYAHFAYAEVETVRQTTPKSCGLAVLACVLRYWEKPATEPELVAQFPVVTGRGHSLQRLREIAQERGLLAFAVSMNGPAGTPAAQLSEQISKGRPVIAAVHCPEGRYFGDPVPVLGTLDARTWRPFGIVPSSTGSAFKHHYVVVFGEDRERYLLMDPAYGIVSVAKPSLLAWWKDEGYSALICSPAPVPAAPSAASPAPLSSASSPPHP